MSLRVLVTNDDGIAAPGLRHLARAARDAGHEVVVAAPKDESSGSSAALTAFERSSRIVADERDLGMNGVHAYAVGGTPAFIARLALAEAFGPAPDAVLSGVNRGANAGRAVLHSGTVGAALTAAAAGRRGIAASLDVLTAAIAAVGRGGAALRALDRVDDEARCWCTPARIAVSLLPSLMAAPAGVVFNVNSPDVAFEELAGVREGGLARFGQVQMAVAERGEAFVRTSAIEEERRPQQGTDLALLADGYASVTVLRSVSQVRGIALEGVEPSGG